MKSTAKAWMLLFFAALLCGCAGNIVDSALANKWTYDLKVLPATGIPLEKAKTTMAQIDQVAKERGFSRQQEAGMPSAQDVLSRNYVMMAHGLFNSSWEIFLTAAYTKDGTLYVSVRESDITSNSDITNQIRRELADRLALIFGKDNVKITKTGEFDFS